MSLLRWLLCLLICSSPLWAQPSRPDLASLRLLPCQEGGRLKPFDTMASESVRRITGKATFQGEDPIETCIRWMGDPQATQTEANLECRNLALKKALDLPAEQRWFALRDLSGNPKLQAMQASLGERARQDELTPQDKELEQLLMRMQALSSILTGEAWKMVPNPTSLEGEWQSLGDLKGRQDDPKAQAAVAALSQLLEASHQHDAGRIQTAAGLLGPALAAMGPVPGADAMKLEVHYNHLHPFRIAWGFYALALCPLLFASGGRSKLYWIGMAAALAGFAMHGYGFYLRCHISGRAPVTNMYESVIWVAFGAVFFALVFEMLQRARYYLMVALVFSTLSLVLADNLPAVLDPSIRPLMPVLRNNFWLTIHVLTITLSYAAFALALGLGHLVCWGYAFRSQDKARLKTLNTALYKAIQVGVLLLAAGTILGGVWANYSWGRFWGWDPKEVWALIALLGYLALLHARYAGWLRFYGLGVGAIVAFMGVMMAWYGVNFVLGAGLHSYGFGSGGGQYVAVWVALEAVFLAFTTVHHRRHEAEDALARQARKASKAGAAE